MTKLKRFASSLLAVVMILSLFTAFAAEEDTVVATFDGGKVMMSEVDELSIAYLYSSISMMNYFSQMMNGTAYTPTEDDYAAAGQSISGFIAQIKILYQKMLDLGCEPFTDAYLAETKAIADNQYMQNMYSYISAGYTEQQASNELLYQGYTPGSIYVDLLYTEITEKIKEKISVDENVSDEDVSAKYAELTEKQKTTYTKTPTSAENLINNGNTCYYLPDGFKYVKHILLVPDDEPLMSEYNAVINNILAYENEIATVTSSAYQPRFDAIVEKAILEEAKENLAASEAELETLKAKLLEATKEDTDAIFAAIEAGESFDTLVEKYTSDTASLNEPYKTNGYIVYKTSISWDEAFKAAVDSLETVGEISEPVVGSYGVHIVKYDSEPVTGSPALEDVAEEIKNTILAERRNNAFNTEATAWIENANVQFMDIDW